MFLRSLSALTHSTPCLTAPVGVQISTGVHPGGQNICWGAPHWQEEKNLAGVHPGSQIHWLGVPCQPTRINSGCNHFANFAYFALGCQETFQTFKPTGEEKWLHNILWGWKIQLKFHWGHPGGTPVHPGAPRPGQ